MPHAGLRALHLLPLLELLGRKDLLHLLGLGLAGGAHPFVLRLHILYFLQVEFVELLRLILVEVQFFDHAVGLALGHLFGRGAFLCPRSPPILRKSARSRQQAKGHCNRKNSLFHSIKIFVIRSPKHLRLAVLMQR